MSPFIHALAGLVRFAIAAVALAAPTLTVGSKRFTESYILGRDPEADRAVAGEATATHSQGLGNTAIVLNALTTGSIDIYPEYTGTIAKEILKLDSVPAARRAQCEAGADGSRGRGSARASTTPTRWRCAPTTRVAQTSRGCPTSRRIRTCGSDSRRNSSDAPTAGRG
jgi:hypothetical protein